MLNYHSQHIFGVGNGVNWDVEMHLCVFLVKIQFALF